MQPEQESSLRQAHEHFVQGMSQISNFWGFPKAMGAIYGALYLSPAPLSLDDLVEQVEVSKGAVSTNVRQLERLNMVQRHTRIGDRKDYYTAETDFWEIIRSILEQRQQQEFERALNTVSESIELVAKAADTEPGEFYLKRMETMKSFFKTFDSLVSAVLALENLVSVSALKTMLEKAKKN